MLSVCLWVYLNDTCTSYSKNGWRSKLEVHNCIHDGTALYPYTCPISCCKLYDQLSQQQLGFLSARCWVTLVGRYIHPVRKKCHCSSLGFVRILQPRCIVAYCHCFLTVTAHCFCPRSEASGHLVTEWVTLTLQQKSNRLMTKYSSGPVVSHTIILA